MQWKHDRLFDGNKLVGTVTRVTPRNKVRWKAVLLGDEIKLRGVPPGARRRLKQRTFDDQDEAKGWLVVTYRLELL